MSERITIKHVESALAAYVTACKAANLIPEGMHCHLEQGTQTYGRAWRVCLTGDMVKDENGHNTWPKGSGCNKPPAGDDYLGWTAAEARASLQDRAAGIWAVLSRSAR